MRDFYRANIDLFKDTEIDVERCVIVEGNWDTNKTTLQRTASPEVSFGSNSKFVDFLDKMAPIVFELIKKIPFSTLPTCNFRDCEFSIFNKDTLPGFRYEEYLKKRKKRFVKKEALLVAKNRWDYIESQTRKSKKIFRNKLIPSLYTIGARNKRDYDYEFEDAVTSRAVHMPEFHVEICCAPWIDQITEHITKAKKGAVYIGHSFLEYSRLSEVLKDSVRILEGDWKRFDSTLYRNMIIVGVALLRCFYPLNDKRIDNHFIAIADAVLIKDYYTPGGNLFRIFHGLPSGVKATNLLGSIINLIALGYCVGKENIAKIDFIVGGDDFLISYKEDQLDFNITEIEDRSTDIGMTFKFLTEKFFNAVKVDDRPTFYKYVIKDGNPIIPFTALYERVLMPWNKRYKDILDIYDYLNAIFPSLASPSSSCIPFYSIYQKVCLLSIGKKISISEIFKMHKDIYQKVIIRKTPIHHKNPQIKMMLDEDWKGFYNDEYVYKTFGIIKSKNMIEYSDFC